MTTRENRGEGFHGGERAEVHGGGEEGQTWRFDHGSDGWVRNKGECQSVMLNPNCSR